jgi:hypothetical protein
MPAKQAPGFIKCIYKYYLKPILLSNERRNLG